MTEMKFSPGDIRALAARLDDVTAVKGTESQVGPCAG